MTRLQLYTAMERIQPNSTAGGAIEPVKLPMQAIFCAAHAFINEKDDDADARVLKIYLLALQNDGFYAFEESKES